MRKYFTISSELPAPKGVECEVVKGIKDPEVQKRVLATSFNMFFKDNDEVVFVAPSVILKQDPFTLYDVPEADATVFRFENILNTNPKFVPAVWDVAPPSYIFNNCIMVKSKQFAKEWLEMTAKPFFKNYSELDVLNMLVYYGDYKTRVRDVSEL